jgi:hypothetical protein
MIKIILKIKIIDAFKNEKFIIFDYEKKINNVHPKE